LGEASDPQPASGTTFAWSQADFDPDSVLDPTLEQLPDALPRTFAVTAPAAGSVQYVVTMESNQGGVLDVVVDGDGAVLGVSART
jgi:hypothetical protein